MRSFVLGKKENIKKDSYIWNTIGGLINAFQSVIILMVLTRSLDMEYAGIFTIAWAIANLVITIGKYGVRNYQVTDVNEKYSFNDYFSNRVIVSILMIIFTCIYVCFLSISNQYAFDKTVIVFLMCYLKLIDSVEDVFHGMYQQHERLDVASKCMSIRLILSTVCLCMCSIIFKDLLISSIITCVFSTFIFVYLLKITYSIFNLPKIQFDFFNAKRILKDCFPIFAGSFLSFYILNAPKYAIDALLSSELQAYYGFISMPVFVISLLNNFVFQPILTTVANCYETKNKDQFFQLIKRQIVVILIITIVALIGSYVLGIPVLSILYNCDLSNYKVDLLILMLGGGILAYVGFLTTIITLMRNQNIILIGYVIGGVLAIVLSQLVVSLYGLRGASILYLLLISVLAVFFSIAFYFNLKTWKEGITSER